MKIEPIPGEPASVLGNSLIISDLHIGIERSFQEEGIRIPTQTKKYIKKIQKLVEKESIQEIIFLGDLKNQIPNLSWQERKEIPNFLKKISREKEIKIIPGNHDGNITKLIPKEVSEKIEIKSIRGYVKDDVYLFHGHTWPRKEAFSQEKILMGHNHPIIVFEDELGRKHNEKSWIRSKINKNNLNDRYNELNWNNPELIVQPAYNELVGGVAFNSSEENFLGPLFKSGAVNIENMTSTLIDGTYIGKIKRIDKIKRGKRNKKN